MRSIRTAFHIANAMNNYNNDRSIYFASDQKRNFIWFNSVKLKVATDFSNATGYGDDGDIVIHFGWFERAIMRRAFRRWQNRNKEAPAHPQMPLWRIIAILAVGPVMIIASAILASIIFPPKHRPKTQTIYYEMMKDNDPEMMREPLSGFLCIYKDGAIKPLQGDQGYSFCPTMKNNRLCPIGWKYAYEKRACTPDFVK